ncbi:MAG TPA: exodeoxyribonuclease VII large subunit [Acidimicrobiales bacterium]
MAALVASREMVLRADRDDETRSISELYTELTSYLDERWGRARQAWVFGEIQKLSDHRSGHCYLDLVDPSVSGRDAPTLKAKCWRTSWAPLKLALSRAGLELAEGTVVRVRGYVDLYAPRGELGFIITELDLEALQLAALGEHARRRKALIDKLVKEELFDANRALGTVEVPLRVGLVASRDTEGCNDFLGVLEGSGFGFHVVLVRAVVQGDRAAREVAKAIGTLGTAEVDVICVVRGGGSQSDLAAFDDEAVARAIATSAWPVLTGVGHTGDVSVADLIAHESFRTPTACAASLAGAVRAWYATHVGEASARVVRATSSLLDELDAEVDQVRRHLVVVGRHRLQRADDALTATAATIARDAPRGLSHAGAAIGVVARRIEPLSRGCVAATTASLAARRTLLAAYDPRRLLERGWSITTDEDGGVLHGVGGLAAGSVIKTQFADGVARSTVTDVDAGVT